MLKMRIFLEKAENSPQRCGLRPQTPLTSGGWGLCPQTSELLFPLNLRVNF